MRTGLSNDKKFIVHFFDTRQRNEPKKTCVRGVHSPYVSPGLCVFCTCGPKLFREVASVLFLGEAKKVKVVGEGQSYFQKAHISLKSETVWD